MHLRRYEARPLASLILRHREPRPHPRDRDTDCAKYSERPDPQSPAEAAVFKKSLEKEGKHEAWSSMSLMRMKKQTRSEGIELTAQSGSREDDPRR